MKKNLVIYNNKMRILPFEALLEEASGNRFSLSGTDLDHDARQGRYTSPALSVQLAARNPCCHAGFLIRTLACRI
jgi:hypothetical protein